MEVISREIYEELAIKPEKFHFLWFTDHFASFESEVIRMWFFWSDVSSVWIEHRLLEGQSVGIFHFEEVSGLEMPEVMQTTVKRFHKQT